MADTRDLLAPIIVLTLAVAVFSVTATGEIWAETMLSRISPSAGRFLRRKRWTWVRVITPR